MWNSKISLYNSTHHFFESDRGATEWGQKSVFVHWRASFFPILVSTIIPSNIYATVLFTLFFIRHFLSFEIWVFELQEFWVARVLSCKSVELQKCWVAKVLSCNCFVLQKFWVANVLGCKCFELQMFWVAKVLSCKCFELQKCWVSKG